mgnify:CR=1 FL=1
MSAKLEKAVAFTLFSTLFVLGVARQSIQRVFSPEPLTQEGPTHETFASIDGAVPDCRTGGGG